MALHLDDRCGLADDSLHPDLLFTYYSAFVEKKVEKHTNPKAAENPIKVRYGK